MESGYSTLRNLMWFVLVLALLSVVANFYVASQLSRNSDELASIRQVLQKELMGTAMGQVVAQSEELQKRMDLLNQNAAGVDTKLQKAQDDFVARMNVELPKIMDNYVKTHTPVIERKAQQELKKRGVPVQ